MKSYRTLALKELLSQKVTSILILIAVVLSTMMTTIVGQSIGVLSAMREQQAIAIGGNRYATFLQMNAEQLHALEQDERLSYVGKSIYMGSLELSPSLTLGFIYHAAIDCKSIHGCCKDSRAACITYSLYYLLN